MEITEKEIDEIIHEVHVNCWEVEAEYEQRHKICLRHAIILALQKMGIKTPPTFMQFLESERKRLEDEAANSKSE